MYKKDYKKSECEMGNAQSEMGNVKWELCEMGIM